MGSMRPIGQHQRKSQFDWTCRTSLTERSGSLTAVTGGLPTFSHRPGLCFNGCDQPLVVGPVNERPTEQDFFHRILPGLVPRQVLRRSLVIVWRVFHVAGMLHSKHERMSKFLGYDQGGIL